MSVDEVMSKCDTNENGRLHKAEAKKCIRTYYNEKSTAEQRPTRSEFRDKRKAEDEHHESVLAGLDETEAEVLAPTKKLYEGEKKYWTKKLGKSWRKFTGKDGLLQSSELAKMMSKI